MSLNNPTDRKNSVVEVTKRAGRGEGSVYRRSDGDGWIAQLIVDGRRVRRKAKTKAAAQAKLQEMRRLVGAGLQPPTGGYTVDDACSRFLNVVAPAKPISPRTVKIYRWAINNHISPAIGKKRLLELTPVHVERVFTSLTDNGAKRQTIANVRSTLRMTLHEAQRQGWVHRNVAELAYVPKAEPSRERRSMTREQVKTLLNVAAGHSLEGLVHLGVMRGLRPGELRGLKWADLRIDAKPYSVTIRQAAKTIEGKETLGPPKTAKSQRALVLSDATAGVLRNHREAQAKQREAVIEAWVEMDLVFPSSRGTIKTAERLRIEFGTLTRTAGLGYWVPYEMRHTAITLHSEAGVPVEELADLAGHTDLRMIMNVYRHRSGPAIDAGAGILDDLS